MGKTFSTQFHATLDELGEFVRECLQKYGIYATAMHAFPFSVEPVSNEKLYGLMLDPTVHEILFTESPADLSDKSGLEFFDRNPGSLILRIGRLVPRGLEESSLGTLQSTSLWKKIATDLKRRAPAGVIGTDEETGASVLYRDHRVTAGAKALSEQGIPLRQDAQSSVVFRPATKEEKR